MGHTQQQRQKPTATKNQLFPMMHLSLRYETVLSRRLATSKSHDDHPTGGWSAAQRLTVLEIPPFTRTHQVHAVHRRSFATARCLRWRWILLGRRPAGKQEVALDGAEELCGLA